MEPDAPSRAAAIILAAGRSTRMGRNKMCEIFAGKPLVRHVAEAAIASRAGPVVVVTGHERERVEDALQGLGVTFVFNTDFAAGMAGSLKCGLRALPQETEAVVMLLGDMPLVSPSIIDALIDAFARQPTMSAIVPVFGGTWGNPVLIGRMLFGEMAKLTGDRGARKFLEAHRDAVLELAVPDEAVIIDIDTPEALREAADGRS